MDIGDANALSEENEDTISDIDYENFLSMNGGDGGDVSDSDISIGDFETLDSN